MQAIVMGFNDHRCLRQGWYAASAGSGGVSGRWTSQAAYFTLPDATAAPADPSISQVHMLHILVSPPQLPDQIQPGISLFGNDERLDHAGDLGLPGGWALVKVALNISQCAKHLNLRPEIRSSDGYRSGAFIPHKLLRNGDHRPLGLLIAAIRLADA